MKRHKPPKQKKPKLDRNPLHKKTTRHERMPENAAQQKLIVVTAD